MRFLRRHWRDAGEIADLRQEIYLRLYQSARNERPVPVKPFLFQIGRNLMIDRLRQKSVVSIEAVGDIESLGFEDSEPSPERRVLARQELRRMLLAMDRLPARCRQVILLRRVQGLSQREVAEKLGVKEEIVENEVARGVRLLADATMDRRGKLLASVRRWKMRKVEYS